MGAQDAAANGEVEQLQRYLAHYFNLDTLTYVSGYFGTLTRENVRRFQCAHLSICSGSEEENGYGVVGPLTRSTIASVCSTGSPYQQQGLNTTSAPYGNEQGGGSSTYSQSTYYAQSGYGQDNTTENNATSCTFNGQTVANGASVLAYATGEATAGGGGTACASQVRRCTNGILLGSYTFSTCTASTIQQNGNDNTTTYSQSGYYSSSTTYQGVNGGGYTNEQSTQYSQATYYNQAGYYSQGAYEAGQDNTAGGGSTGAFIGISAQLAAAAEALQAILSRLGN